MGFKHYLIIVILLLMLINVYYYWRNQSPFNLSNNANFYSISELRQNNFSTGEFTTEGYVVKIYSCPICPRGLQCKPCMRNNFIISQNNKLLENYALTDKELIIFADNVQPFELGQKYLLTIKILDSKSTTEPINDIELVNYRWLKP